METDTAFLHSCSTLTRFGSIAKTLATRRSCSRAISNGFSRRCETGASTVVTSTPFSAQIGTFGLGGRSLLDGERDRPECRRPRLRAVREEAQLVVAAREQLPSRVAPRYAERVTARQYVTQTGEQPDATAVRARPLEIGARHGRHRPPPVASCHRTAAEAGPRRWG